MYSSLKHTIGVVKLVNPLRIVKAINIVFMANLFNWLVVHWISLPLISHSECTYNLNLHRAYIGGIEPPQVLKFCLILPMLEKRQFNCSPGLPRGVYLHLTFDSISGKACFSMSKNLCFVLQRSKLFFTFPNFLTIFCRNYLINLHSSCVHIKV